MAKVSETKEVVDQFMKELMNKIPITELYTSVTNEQFYNLQSRLKARNVLRQSKTDSSPSMQEVPNKNLLWDFAEASERPGKPGRGYNHIDILLLSKKCRSYKEAIHFLADYSHISIPEEISNNLGRDSDKRDFLAHLWAACRIARKTLFDDPARFANLREYIETRCIPWSQRFWETMDIGIWPEEAVVSDIVSQYNKKGAINDIAKTLPRVGYKALVFPLYDQYGNFTGTTIRETAAKRFWKVQDRRCGFYGLREALAHEDVYSFEGEMNYVSIVAAIYRIFGEDKFEEHIPYGFCTGSRSNSLDSLRDKFRKVLYFPDIQIRSSKEDLSTQEVVMRVYNSLRAKEFWTIEWEGEKNKFDLDDFLIFNKNFLFTICIGSPK